MANRNRFSAITCSFCGKSPKEVGKLITGPSVHICSECVGMCNEILRQDSAGSSPADMGLETLPTPREIKTFLDQYVVGQEGAKQGIAVAAYNHFKRLISRTTVKENDVEIEKTNMLMIGATGTGKTLIAQTLARLLKVPFTIVDATIFTEAGYVGEDVENMLVRLLQAADNDVARAERGIIYIDEFDKISRKSANPSITRDVSGEGVQQAMLKILEGTVASIPPKGGRKHPEQNLIQINTRDILFICGGAFVGLEDIIEARIGESRMGFNNRLKDARSQQSGNILEQVEPDDLIKFGLIPEAVGRIPAVFGLGELDEESLLTILTEPRNALAKQYQKLFDMEGVRLTFTREALREIVRIALQKKTGARGLRNVLEKALVPVMFELPSLNNIRECMVDKDTITQGKPPTFVRRREKKSA